MDVSIIIVAWNVREFLQKCLESVFKETKGIEFEVVYVDNASKDGSVEMVRNDFPDVKIIENEENNGFNRANNQGLKNAQGRYVLLLNSDTIVLDNAIGKTIEFADANPETGVIGCKVLNSDRTLQRTCFMYPSLLNLFLSALYLNKLFPRSHFFGRERMTWCDFNEALEVETVCGCCSLIRKEALDQVGLLDERYFMYGDDPDLCRRIEKAGWKNIFTPAGEIIHFGGQTTKQMAREFRWQLHGSILIFFKLHRSKLEFVLARLLTALFFLLRVPVWLCNGIIHKQDRTHSMCTAGTYIIAAWYCLVSWKNLLMNKDALRGRL